MNYFLVSFYGKMKRAKEFGVEKSDKFKFKNQEF